MYDDQQNNKSTTTMYNGGDGGRVAVAVVGCVDDAPAKI